MNKAVALVLLAGGMRKRAVGPSGAARRRLRRSSEHQRSRRTGRPRRLPHMTTSCETVNSSWDEGALGSGGTRVAGVYGIIFLHLVTYGRRILLAAPMALINTSISSTVV
jgi:hypothetical protein